MSLSLEGGTRKKTENLKLKRDLREYLNTVRLGAIPRDCLNSKVSFHLLSPRLMMLIVSINISIINLGSLFTQDNVCHLPGDGKSKEEEKEERGKGKIMSKGGVSRDRVTYLLSAAVPLSHPRHLFNTFFCQHFAFTVMTPHLSAHSLTYSTTSSVYSPAFICLAIELII